MRFLNSIVFVAGLLFVPACLAQDNLKLDADPPGNSLMVQGAPAMLHFHSSPDHARYSWLVGAEWLHSSHWLAGYSYFNNSFNQKSQYIYGGYWWPINAIGPNWYAKLTGGLLLGYKPPYEDKVPFNHNGKSPGIVPGLGYKMGRFNAQLNLLGGAGLMLTVGYDLARW
jgi:hypothetical protein